MYKYMIYEVPELKDLISWVDPEVFSYQMVKRVGHSLVVEHPLEVQ